ncbi:putative peptidylprolyl isomerase [Cryptosporidium canis]|uniref:Peptidylprolyl isomerase n=1 Tax=Cryptosporidium canis TaxID=195482 RepID=A0ABQ8P4G7_9CRYT|nr:putative peptidylprolyl isomerase [Cryptosporidium canis]KAJ1613935.1 putative peptidylprolyl isomerase [Cryptosporidium canis]
MQTSKEEYEFCRKILDNYDKHIEILKSSQGCSHDRSKERELYERSTRDKLDAIKLFCDEGNIKYQNNQIEDAIFEYKNALIYVDYTFPEDKALEEEYNNLITRINLNLSACFLKINEFNMTILHCNKVLQNDPNNIKALYRLSQAYMNIYEFNKALEIIEGVLSRKDGEHSAFIKLRNDIILMENKYKSSNCDKYKSLFSN